MSHLYAQCAKAMPQATVTIKQMTAEKIAGCSVMARGHEERFRASSEAQQRIRAAIRRVQKEMVCARYI